ncbi:MAG: sigma-54-dependent Fis family transcriptional regulator [Myxococcales bacterium]|nr:sigma-54-dependent Fis family transcriptional regulator [Myxococcales bacterium]
MRRVLIVEPDARLRGELASAVCAAGWEASPFASLADAPPCIGADAPDAALLAVEHADDLAAIASLRGAAPTLPVVAMGTAPSLDVAVDAMKHGARDFLRKPFAAARLISTLGAAFPDRRDQGDDAILTADPQMEQLLRQAEAAAATEATVQIVGESGTGKDLLARLVHRRSARRAGPFVAVNCAALPESLAESELFGHEPGAFTGAREFRPGQFASADGGTLLLDEVSEMAPSLQPKLLRVLQEREVQAVGAVAPRSVDVRVVATSQRDLGAEAAAGRFREDLHYRLDVIVLHVPPLRDRAGDVPLLARHFLERFAAASGCKTPRLSAETLRVLRRHSFRGNVRELENLMRRAVVLFPGGEVEPDQLLSPGVAAELGVVPGVNSFNLREIERQVILRSLAETGGNRTHASELLGISVRTLRNKIKLYALA